MRDGLVGGNGVFCEYVRLGRRLFLSVVVLQRQQRILVGIFCKCGLVLCRVDRTVLLHKVVVSLVQRLPCLLYKLCILSLLKVVYKRPVSVTDTKERRHSLSGCLIAADLFKVTVDISVYAVLFDLKAMLLSFLVGSLNGEVCLFGRDLRRVVHLAGDVLKGFTDLLAE